MIIKKTYVSKIKISRIINAINRIRGEVKKYSLYEISKIIKELFGNETNNDSEINNELLDSNLQTDFLTKGKLINTTNITFTKNKKYQTISEWASSGNFTIPNTDRENIYKIDCTNLNTIEEVYNKINNIVFKGKGEIFIWNQTNNSKILLIPNYNGKIEFIENMSPCIYNYSSQFTFGVCYKAENEYTITCPNVSAYHTVIYKIKNDSKIKYITYISNNNALDHNANYNVIYIYYKDLHNLIGNGYHIAVVGGTPFPSSISANDLEFEYPYLKAESTVCKIKNYITNKEMPCVLDKVSNTSDGGINIYVPKSLLPSGYERFNPQNMYTYAVDMKTSYFSSNWDTNSNEVVNYIKNNDPNFSINLVPIYIGQYLIENVYFSPYYYRNGNSLLLPWYYLQTFKIYGNSYENSINVKSTTYIDGIKINNEDYFTFDPGYYNLIMDNLIYKKI